MSNKRDPSADHLRGTGYFLFLICLFFYLLLLLLLVGWGSGGLVRNVGLNIVIYKETVCVVCGSECGLFLTSERITVRMGNQSLGSE